MAAKAGLLVVDIFATTVNTILATSNLKFILLPIGLTFAAILIFELREGLKLKTRGIEVDNNSIRYYESRSVTKTERNIADIESLIQITFWNQDKEFRVKFTDGETITFDAKADPDGDLCRLVESKTNLTFQEQK